MQSSPGNGVPSVGEQDAKRTADLGRGAREDDLVLDETGMKWGYHLAVGQIQLETTWNYR
jgi:hypothetical protein